MMNSPKTLIVVGGGTGGHVFPLLNLIQYIQKNTDETSPLFSEISFRWIGERDSIESRLTETHNIPFSAITCGKLRRYFSLKTFFVPFQIFIGILQSLVIIFDEKPVAIFSKGGYVSIPVSIAAWILRRPIYLHESDSVPGLANRIVAKFARGIFCTFHEAEKYFYQNKIYGHGPLLSEDIGEVLKETPELSKKTQLLVSCGSQGSSTIFDTLIQMLESEKSPVKNFTIHLVLGTKNAQYRQKFSTFENVKIYEFFYDQKAYFRIARNCDIVIARSGSSIFEFEALGLYMILIPHPHTGNNHQYFNAKIFEKKGHKCILQENLKKELPGVLEKYKNYKKNTTILTPDMSIYSQICREIMH